MVHIPDFRLTAGDHGDIESTGQGCIMNIIALVQGEAPTDRPQGVDEAYRTLAIYCNDNLPFTARQRLLRFLPRLMNTKTDSWYELARRMQRLLVLEREVCGSEYPMTGFLEHMGPNLPQRIDCLVTQIVHATERTPMHGREREICEAIERALDDLLPDHELTDKQRQDLADLSAVAASRDARIPSVPWVLNEVLAPLMASAMRVNASEAAGEPA